ncbi:MAG: helix-turn-helix domain-containing protein [Myxococcales bacterium]|nr:helix-turn-helix domain-containing protein [Myxococcales bacterium]
MVLDHDDDLADSGRATAEEPGAGPRAARVVCIGGGRGGVGKALLSANLGVYLAQLGRRVALCDADPSGANLHTTLGLDTPPLATADDLSAGRARLVPTSVPGLMLLPTAYDPWTFAPKHPSRKAHWLLQLGRLDVDYAVLHLGTATDSAALDAFHEADVGICVASPEPAAIEATYRFCRALFARRLRRSLMRQRFKLRVVERAIATLPPMPSPRDLIAHIARMDEGVANVAATALLGLRPYLLIGMTRLRRDLDLGVAMSSLAERYLGIALDYLGHIEQDDSVWLTSRRRRPLLIDAPTCKSARNIERVARRVLAIFAQVERTSGAEAPAGEHLWSRLSKPMTLYDVLGVPRTAGEDEIRRAFKLQREIFREGSLPIVSLVDATRMGEELGRISEAYDTLLDPARKRAYDASIFPDVEPSGPHVTAQRSASSLVELEMLQAELAREVTPETQFTGALLRRAREAQGLDVAEISKVTRISAAYVRAIEAEDASALPARVYVRGFVQQIAKALRLDPAQVTRTYLKRVHSTLEGSES